MATRDREWVQRRVEEKMNHLDKTESSTSDRAPQREPDRSWRERSPRRYDDDRGSSALPTGDYYLDRMIKRDRARCRSFWLDSDEE
jgi:hypothetical protein